MTCCAEHDATVVLEMSEIPRVGGNRRSIDYFRSPESFIMIRNATGMAPAKGDKILKPSTKGSAIDVTAVTSGLFVGDVSRPPRSLLEASARRVAAHKVAEFNGVILVLCFPVL